MQIAHVIISFDDFMPDTENQIYEHVTVHRFFHTEDNNIDKESFQKLIYKEILKEFGNIHLYNVDNQEIESYKDIKLTLSTQL